MSTEQQIVTPPDLEDIQGDIIVGLPKKQELFYFFQINNMDEFRQVFARTIVPLITSTQAVMDAKGKIQQHKAAGNEGLLPITCLNVSFSSKGLSVLGIPVTELTASSDVFTKGQLSDAKDLGDYGVTDTTFHPAWRQEFTTDIHGVFLITGPDQPSVEATADDIENAFFILDPTKAVISKVLSFRGQKRPNSLSKHEHFGYRDGVSQPAVNGIDPPIIDDPTKPPLPPMIDPGVLVTGLTGDKQAGSRAPWAKNGSFMVFRQLEQDVIKFNQFLVDHPLLVKDDQGKDLTTEEGQELLGAKMVGRWKSGAPIELFPFRDANTPDDTKDADMNRFIFNKSQINCPFASHIRKTHPRDDLPEGGVKPHRIMRQGIPYGPELTDDESAARGLAFVCYQSSIGDGFKFLQKTWANNIRFPPNTTAGFDPIIGQISADPKNVDDDDRHMQLVDLPGADKNLELKEEFVISKGGEYFFSPSISTLQSDKFSTL